MREVRVILQCSINGAVAHTCNPRPWERESGGLEIQGHPWLQSQLKTSLGWNLSQDSITTKTESQAFLSDIAFFFFLTPNLHTPRTLITQTGSSTFSRSLSGSKPRCLQGLESLTHLLLGSSVWLFSQTHFLNMTIYSLLGCVNNSMQPLWFPRKMHLSRQ